MKTQRNILIAFILNFAFSIFEFAGGLFTKSVAIISDSIHDMGDALSIGIAFFLEAKSKKEPDENYTYGYARYSVIGSVITTLILSVGSVAVVFRAIERIKNPVAINYNGMIIFAIIGLAVNCLAAYFTREGDSLNQKAVNLHMLEDVSGWAIVLIGAIIMRFTNLYIIDSALSIAVAVFIFINAIGNLKAALGVFLEKVPEGIDIGEIKEHILEVEGVIDVHHIHIWSMDAFRNFATMHIVTDGEAHEIKEKVREELKEHGISHATLELEDSDEYCHEQTCVIEQGGGGHHHHHHHHHHH